jgi:hypothetical protein
MKPGSANSRLEIPETAAQIALRELDDAIADRRRKLGENLGEILSLQAALQRRYDAASRLDAELDQLETTRIEVRRVVNGEIRVEPLRLITITHFEEAGEGQGAKSKEATAA